MPFNVLRHMSWDRAPRVEAVAAFLIKAGAPALFANVVAYVGVSLVTSWALQALAPKPDFGGAGGAGGSSGLLVNAKSPTAPHDFVYGEVRKGGTITYYETTGTNNKFLHQIVALAGHPVDSIGDIYINDEVVTLNGSGFVTSDPWNSKIRIQKFDGTQTTAPASLLAESNQIDASFVGNGIAYLYIRYEFDQDVFANGLPLVTAVVRGKRVFDPRTSTTAYSNNAALCVRDYITANYGLKDTAIDEVAFSAAANISDENVNLAGGGTEKRYTINGVISAGQTHGDVLQSMMTACAGSLFWGAGNWKLVVGDYVAPAKTLTLDDLRGPISLSTRVNLQDQFNGVQGTFIDASNRWISADYPPIKSTPFETEDGGEQTLLDLALPFTTSAASAQRLAKLTLFRGREQMTITADFGLNAFDVEVGEIIAFTNPRYGFEEKEFEVTGWSFGAAEAGDLRVTLTLRETSEAAFDWDADEKAIINNNTSLPSPLVTPAVGISLGAELRVANQQVVGVLIIDVVADSPFVDRFEVEFKRSEEAEFITLGQSSIGRFEAVGVSDGLFDIRARSINVFGVRGPFNTITGFYATLFEGVPDDVTNFSANVVGNTLHLSWTPVSDLDLSHYKLRYSSLTSGAEYQKSVDLVQKISRPANTATVPAQTGTYFIKAVDKLGISSSNAASIVIDTNVADIDFLNVVETQDEHPNFFGAKDGVVVVNDDASNFITLDTSTLFDDASGDFDDAFGLFDGGFGSVRSSGTYDFDGYIDLGEKYVSRVTTSMALDFLDYINDFDSALGVFDAREGDFDGDPSAFDTTSVKTQVSTTNDDPAGSPVWSEYRDFIVGDINARALRFRAVLASTSGGNSPAVRELSVEVDMPDRLEADDDLTYTGSLSVTFPTAFKAIPALGIAATLADGDRYVISGKSRSGFTITTFTGASVSANPTTIDYVAKGYGKELT
jgi:hypothetical protein